MLDTSTIVTYRRQLAAALRLGAKFELSEGVCNHFSVRIPGELERYLINPRGVHWTEITASSLLLVDGEGRVLEGDGAVEDTALHIHVEGHRAKPDAICILHTHMPYATALTCLDKGRLLYVHQNHLRYWGRVSYDDDYQGLALDSNEGQRIGNAFEAGDIVFMKHHGVVVCGPTVAEAFHDLYYLERACYVQVLAMSTGRPLQEIDPAVAAHGGEQFAKLAAFEADYHFAALERILARELPDYRE
jgi:ribulose-5-phosphate 4-epimerase/fuculose-1-phosphate aldolase